MKVLIIGGGAAGMMAAYSAATAGADCTILERNEKTGKKLYITGKGRCNITNDCSQKVFLDSVVTNPKFLYSALRNFFVNDTFSFFEDNGVPLKTERGNRVFPVSDKSSDIIRAMNISLQRLGVHTITGCRVTSVIKKGEFFHVYTTDGTYTADRVIIATGGITYPATGSTGDGYLLAKALGHTIVQPVPSLAGIRTEKPRHELAGLALKNAQLCINVGSRVIYSAEGELLFTHVGISGALALTASAHINRLSDYSNVTACIDLKPYIDTEELDRRVLKLFGDNLNKNFGNILGEILPNSIIPLIIENSGISPYQKVNTISKEERKRLVDSIKCVRLSITGIEGAESAVITAGGVSTAEINPKTMESKLQEGLFFAGEIIDVDALTGGYNLQIALSTGYTAGISAARTAEDK